MSKGFPGLGYERKDHVYDYGERRDKRQTFIRKEVKIYFIKEKKRCGGRSSRIQRRKVRLGQKKSRKDA